MGAIIGALIVGGIIGWVAAHAWLNTPTRQTAEPRYYRRRETGETYHHVGRAYLAGAFGESGDLWLLAPTGKSGQEAWPEKRIRKEFDEVSEPGH